MDIVKDFFINVIYSAPAPGLRYGSIALFHSFAIPPEVVKCFPLVLTYLYPLTIRYLLNSQSPASMLTEADTVKKLPRLTTLTSSRTWIGSTKNFSMKESSSLDKGINWLDREILPSPLLIRKPSADYRPGSVRGRKARDENHQQKSVAMSESPAHSYSKFDTKEHIRCKKTSVGSSLQLRHKATITSFPFDPPFGFQLTNPSSENKVEDKEEAEPISPSSVYADQSFSSTSNVCESVHENQHWHQHQNQLQPQCFSPTTSADSSDHNIHEYSFYTNEVSNLKFQVIELEYINASLENKVRKYRDEIRLFKQDIKGYKLDGRQLAELLMEKEDEIETLHKKITQLLNQDCLPSPPRSTPSSMNGGSYNRYGHITDVSIKQYDFVRNESGRNHGHVAEQIGHAETDNKPQWWM